MKFSDCSVRVLLYEVLLSPLVGYFIENTRGGTVSVGNICVATD